MRTETVQEKKRQQLYDEPIPISTKGSKGISTIPGVQKKMYIYIYTHICCLQGNKNISLGSGLQS